MPKRKGDVRKTFADISLLKRDMKYKIKVNFKEGLINTYNWFISKGVK
jgi:nucleoside-diphosphate-sugar epimerase